MQTLEIPQTSPDIDEQIDPRMKRVIESTPSDNYEFRQMQLIAEKCVHDNPGITFETLTRSNLEATAAKWADLEKPDSSYSNAWRNLVKHPDFEKHSRFKNNYANVDLKDVEYFMETGKLPK